MPITKETKEIGQHTYVMETLGALTGRQVLLRLARPAGAMLTKGLGSLLTQATSGKKVGIADLDATQMLAGVSDALGELDDEDLVFICDKFAERCTVLINDPTSGGQTQHPMPLSKVFNSHFAGRYDEMVMWLWWGIGVNRFFGSALERLARAAVKTPSPSPEDATGGAGGSSSPSE